MSKLLVFIAGFMAGGLIGLVMTCIIVGGSRGDGNE